MGDYTHRNLQRDADDQAQVRPRLGGFVAENLSEPEKVLVETATAQHGPRG